jgi:rifampicin phosphotransferase
MSDAFQVCMEDSGPYDTARHPRFRYYSDANFAEVAPDRISPLAWSALGPYVEAAFRDLYCRVEPSLSALVKRPEYAFLGYYAFKPYHCVDGLLTIVGSLPHFGASDLTRMYLRGLCVDNVRVDARRSLVGQAKALRRASGLLAEVPGLVNRAELDVQLAEEAASPRRPLDPPLYLLLARALRSAWKAHIYATSYAALLSSWGESLGRHLLGEDWQYAAGFLSPAETVWDGFRGQGPGHPWLAFREHRYYEIAGSDAAWAAPSVDTMIPAGAADRIDPLDLDSGELIALAELALLEGAGTSMNKALRALCRAARVMLANRERTKFLAMRAQHVARIAATAAGKDAAPGGGWAGCTLQELAERRLDGIVLLQSELRHQARPMPSDLVFAPDDNPSPVRSEAASAAKPVIPASPGRATGVAWHGLVPADAGRVLVLERGDSPNFEQIRRAAAVVTEQGSILSHVSIICRSAGIPAVVNVAGARRRFPEGARLTVDGTTGEIVMNGSIPDDAYRFRKEGNVG